MASLQGLLGGSLLPEQTRTPSQPSHRDIQLGAVQNAGTGMRKAVGGMMGTDTRTDGERAKEELGKLDPTNPADQEKIIALVAPINPEKAMEMQRQFALEAEAKSKETALVEANSAKQQAFTTYITTAAPELTELARTGVVTPENLKTFQADTAAARFQKGTTFTVQDEEGNNFTMTNSFDKAQGEMTNKYSPIGNAPAQPVGKVKVTGGEFGLSAEDEEKRLTSVKGATTKESKFQENRTTYVDSLPTLYASKENLTRVSGLLDTMETGGPVNMVALGIDNFLGTKSANKAEAQLILGKEMYKSLKPLFGGLISEGERAAIEKIYGSLQKGNSANEGILRSLQKSLSDSVLKAELYQSSSSAEEYDDIVKKMFPAQGTPTNKKVVWGE